MNEVSAASSDLFSRIIFALEAHDKLAGWAQFLGAMLALIIAVSLPLILDWKAEKKADKAKAQRVADLKLFTYTNMGTVWFALQDIRVLLDAKGRILHRLASLHIRRIEETRQPLISIPLWSIDDVRLSLAISEITRTTGLVTTTLSTQNADCRPIIVESQAKIVELFDVLPKGIFDRPEIHGPNSELMRARTRAYARRPPTTAPCSSAPAETSPPKKPSI